MRHNKNRGMKIGSDAAHTKALKRNLVCSLFLNDRIKTTETRAKAIRGDVDRVITWAKRGDLHSRRLALAKLNNKEVVREVFEKVEQGMWADRTCGFTRIYKLGPRKGDNAPMVIMELVTEPCTPKKKAAKAEAAPVAAEPVQEAVVEEAAEVAEAVEAVEETAEAAEEKAE
jgi:large subunit ribosomal protein L17